MLDAQQGQPAAETFWAMRVDPSAPRLEPADEGRVVRPLIAGAHPFARVELAEFAAWLGYRSNRCEPPLPHLGHLSGPPCAGGVLGVALGGGHPDFLCRRLWDVEAVHESPQQRSVLL